MDRKSKPHIISILLYFTAFLLPVALWIRNFFSEKQLLLLQIQELSTLYPEKAMELSENLSYYHQKVFRVNIRFLALLLLSELLFFLSLSFYKGYRQKKDEEALKLEFSLLSKKISSMQNLFPAQISDDPVFSCSMLEDIYGQLKDLEYAIFSMQAKLTEEEHKKKELITDISHQLKTPLSSIRMSHDLSMEEGLSEEERFSFLEMETKEILKMEALLGELVKLSRLEYNMIQLQPGPGSFKDTIREAVSHVFLKAQAKNIKLLVKMEQDLTLCHDHKWTVEAFTNLLENAIKYSCPDSEIQIRISPLVQNVLVEIEDDGIGIPEGEEHLIFKRFYRGSNAVQASKEGAGIGLYLARNIFEQQGGTIMVKRKHGPGSIFKVTLPLFLPAKPL